MQKNLLTIIFLVTFIVNCEKQDEIEIQDEQIVAAENLMPDNENATDKLNYNPASCKKDAGEMVYFALGKTVF